MPLAMHGQRGKRTQTAVLASEGLCCPLPRKQAALGRGEALPLDPADPVAAAVVRHCPQVVCGLESSMRRHQPTWSGTYPRPELIGRLSKSCSHVAGNCELVKPHVNVSMVCSYGGEAWKEAILVVLLLCPCSISPQHPRIPGSQTNQIISP